MNTEDQVQLNAYVDGELSNQQQARMLELMQQDQEVARQVRETKQLKNWLQLAYADPPKNTTARVAPVRVQTFLPWVAAVLLVCGGALIGWLAHPVAPPERLVVLDGAGRGQAPATADSPETRIAFHLTSPEQTVAGELLDEVETMLVSYEQQGRPLRVEIISNGEGLGLLRERLTAHRDRIARMAERYDNLTFVACLNTVERLRNEQGIEVRLVPGAQVTRSGVTRVVRRQREGWAYIRV